MKPRFVGLLLLLLSMAVGHAEARPEDSLKAEARRLASWIMRGTSFDLLRELCDRFGPRLTGSVADQEAADWAVKQFRSYGIQDVRLEPFMIPNGWERGHAEGEIYAPIQRYIHIEPVGWSPATPQEGVRAAVVVIDNLAEENLRAHSAQIQGSIVLLDSARITPENINKMYGQLVASYGLLKRLGAQALLFPDGRQNNAPGDWVDTDNGKAAVLELPVAEIGMEDALLLRRLLQRGPVTIGFAFQNKVSGAMRVNNVVAEIRGSEKPEEWILVGAHLDSWDLGTGAQDNGTGAVMVLEAAKAIAAASIPPRRSIRFVLWTGEEQGLLGSKAYIREHHSELERCVAVLNTDYGAGHPQGWKVEGRKDLEDALAPISSSFLEDFSGAAISSMVEADTDHLPFLLQGVPTMDLWVDVTHYDDLHHKSGDTSDKVDALNLKADAAVVAVTAYVLSQIPNRLATRIGRKEIDEILQKAELKDYLIAHGDWKP